MPEFHEVYRTPHERSCRERALVLSSQGIPFQRLDLAGFHVLLVEDALVERAAEELRRYEEENRGLGRRAPLPPAAPLAVPASATFAFVLIAFGLFQWRSALGIDWLAVGIADAGAIRSGAVWRALTALTLHADLAHLASNLVFGLPFGYLVAHTHGGGLGWLAIAVAGFLGNVTNAWVQPPEHLSLGASTAVFGAIGILCGSEARRRHLLLEARTRRLAPVGVALIFLAYLGLGEVQPPRSVDVLAHIFGLAWGLGIGALLPAAIRRPGVRVQVLCGVGALLLVAAGWAAALFL